MSNVNLNLCLSSPYRNRRVYVLVSIPSLTFCIYFNFEICFLTMSFVVRGIIADAFATPPMGFRDWSVLSFGKKLSYAHST